MCDRFHSVVGFGVQLNIILFRMERGINTVDLAEKNWMVVGVKINNLSRHFTYMARWFFYVRSYESKKEKNKNGSLCKLLPEIEAVGCVHAYTLSQHFASSWSMNDIGESKLSFSLRFVFEIEEFSRENILS